MHGERSLAVRQFSSVHIVHSARCCNSLVRASATLVVDVLHSSLRIRSVIFGFFMFVSDCIICRTLSVRSLVSLIPIGQSMQARLTLGAKNSGVYAVFQKLFGSVQMFRSVSELINGGEGGIRTPDRLTPMSDFESGAFNRALPPLR
jgi:hypothetical protein